MQKTIYKNNLDEIHSADAYYRNVFFKDSVLIIPYINLGISNHKINETNNLMYINFAYMIFTNVCYLKVYEKNDLVVNNCSENFPSYYFGGYNFDNSVFVDMEIKAQNAYIQLVENYKLSSNIFIPSIHHLKNLGNISEDSANDFYSFGNQNPIDKIGGLCL